MLIFILGSLVFRNCIHKQNHTCTSTVPPHYAYRRDSLRCATAGDLDHTARGSILLMLRSFACLLALLPGTVGLRIGAASLSRRNALVFGAASLGVVPHSASAKLEGDELKGVLDRAASGKLDISKLIERAKINDLIDPKDIPTCASLESIKAFDEKAVQQLIVQKRDLSKKIKDAKKDGTFDEALNEELKELVTVLSRVEAQVTKVTEAETTRMCTGGF